jgi:hypothetical protein
MPVPERPSKLELLVRQQQLLHVRRNGPQRAAIFGAILHRVHIRHGFHRHGRVPLPGQPHAFAELQSGLLNVMGQSIGPVHVWQVIAVRIGGGIAVFMTGIEPTRLAVHHPRVRLRQRVGIALHGLAVECDGGQGDNGSEFQLEELPTSPRQGLDDSALGEDPVAEPSDSIAAPLDHVAEQRIGRAVGDAEDSLEVRQGDEIGGAGRDANGDCHTALLRVAMIRLASLPVRSSDFRPKNRHSYPCSRSYIRNNAIYIPPLSSGYTIGSMSAHLRSNIYIIYGILSGCGIEVLDIQLIMPFSKK